MTKTKAQLIEAEFRKQEGPMDISLKWTASRRGRRISVTEHMRNFWPSAMMKVSNTEAMPTYIEGCFVEKDSTGPAAHSHDMVCGYCGHRISVLESNRWNG